MTMPEQRPGRSTQEVGTPPELVTAVERRFGALRFDLAANEDNAICTGWLGPGSDYATDAFSVDWAGMWTRGYAWLNPPFDDIAPWARKCVLSARDGAFVLMLVPASTGSIWYARYVQGHARVIPLAPRVTFLGHDTPYPKDLILCVYNPWVDAGVADQWRWDVGDNTRCRKCGRLLKAVETYGGGAVARQCPLCLAFAPLGAFVGTEPAKKPRKGKKDRLADLEAKVAEAERQAELFK